MSDPQTEFDSPWKELIENYFKAFTHFFFPEASQQIDWTQPVEFLDKELQQVVRDAELGKRLADKLVRVFLNDGSDAWVLIHVEIQSQPESDFAARMFQYYYRIRDRYSRQVASFGVLGDDRETWRPQHFADELFGCRVDFRFPVVKLLDYRDRWSELERGTNPFAIVVMAHLKALDTRHNRRERQQWKFSLIRRLYELGYQAQDVINLFHFIDWLMSLPEDLDREFWQQIRLFEEQQRMQYVTSVERRAKQEGIEQGIEQGIRRGKLELVRQLLSQRFSELDDARLSRLETLSSAQLDDLARQVFQWQTVDELDTWLASLDSET